MSAIQPHRITFVLTSVPAFKNILQFNLILFSFSGTLSITPHTVKHLGLGYQAEGNSETGRMNCRLQVMTLYYLPFHEDHVC